MLNPRVTFLDEAGRLYRFGLSVAPFLRGYQRAPEVGHYFIDVKDYTRRTAMLKEDVMADFIRREFYAPILAIAREYHHGLPQLGDRGGVHLNNLLGAALALQDAYRRGDRARALAVYHQVAERQVQLVWGAAAGPPKSGKCSTRMTRSPGS